MALNALEWFFRMAMLVLAGLVTLAILASIDAMSRASRQAALPVATEQPAVEAAPIPEPDRRDPASRDEAARTPDATGATAVAGAAPAPLEDERWLEAIAYGLLALAGLFVIAILVLMRGVANLRRIALALETGGDQPQAAG